MKAMRLQQSGDLDYYKNQPDNHKYFERENSDVIEQNRNKKKQAKMVQSTRQETGPRKIILKRTTAETLHAVLID